MVTGKEIDERYMEKAAICLQDGHKITTLCNRWTLHFNGKNNHLQSYGKFHIVRVTHTKIMGFPPSMPSK